MSEPTALGAFLRARREGLSPGDVGLPDSGRRRTPGLRREEVAALAGVSIDYLVRLEQGRDTNPSPAVMRSIADALLLDADDRGHLYHLMHLTSTPELCPESLPPQREVAPTVRQLVDRFGATPAFVLGPIFDVLAWNAAWEALVTPIGLLDDRTAPNLARFTFLDPRARATYPDWEASADEQAHGLRAESLRLEGDPSFDALLAQLQPAPGFAERWAAHRVTVKRRRSKRIVHPTAGELRIAHEVLHLPDPADQRVVVWLPADDATEEAVRRATMGETALRAV